MVSEASTEALTRFNNLTKSDIEGYVYKAHADLAELYRGKSVDWPQINRLWAQIEMWEKLLAVKEDNDSAE